MKFKNVIAGYIDNLKSNDMGDVNFSISVYCNSPEDIETAEKIIRSIKFNKN